MSKRFDVGQAQPSQVWRIQGTQPINVPKRISAGRIAESRGIRHRADSTAIEHDQDDAPEGEHERRLAQSTDYTDFTERTRPGTGLDSPSFEGRRISSGG